MENGKRVETSCATVELLRPQLVVCRYAPGAKVTAAGIMENIEARLRLVGNAPHVAITIFPDPEDFDMTMLQADHYRGTKGDAGLQAMAMVAEGTVINPVVKLYFAYFPSKFKAEVFASESEGMAWIQAQHALLKG